MSTLCHKKEEHYMLEMCLDFWFKGFVLFCIKNSDLMCSN